jgi:hypothetical protein
MAHKATAPAAAERVLEARELARAGAGNALIERLTGFSTRFVRGIAREYGGTFSCKPRDPQRFLRDRQRRAHVPYVVLFYENQRTTVSLSKRLLDTYWSYRTIIRPGVLSFNECALAVELYETGKLVERQCRVCPLIYFVVVEDPLCPKCRLKKRVFCPQCGRQKAGKRLRVGALCSGCSPGSVVQPARLNSGVASGTVAPGDRAGGVARRMEGTVESMRASELTQDLAVDTGDCGSEA